MSRRLSHLLVPCAVFLAACADSVISPESENELTQDDAQFVAEMIDATAAGLLNDFFDSSQSDPAAGAFAIGWLFSADAAHGRAHLDSWVLVAAAALAAR